MTPRRFLVSGLLAGLLAGAVAFLVAHQLGEPSVHAAIAFEAAHAHEHGADLVSRATQSTWGLATGTLTVGIALGGLVALAAAGAMGRLGRLGPGQSTAAVTALGLLSVSVVPFLKYPANPPSVGNPDTIGSRTELFFGFLAVSVLAAALSTVLAQQLWKRSGSYAAVVAGGASYVVLVGAAAVLFPTVDETGAFPAGTLWAFRVSSLLVLVSLWTVLGVALTGLVLRLHRREAEVVARRELAASL